VVYLTEYSYSFKTAVALVTIANLQFIITALLSFRKCLAYRLFGRMTSENTATYRDITRDSLARPRRHKMPHDKAAAAAAAVADVKRCRVYSSRHLESNKQQARTDKYSENRAAMLCLK
jgi:hypothetical protein